MSLAYTSVNGIKNLTFFYCCSLLSDWIPLSYSFLFFLFFFISKVWGLAVSFSGYGLIYILFIFLVHDSIIPFRRKKIELTKNFIGRSLILSLSLSLTKRKTRRIKLETNQDSFLPPTNVGRVFCLSLDGLTSICQLVHLFF